MAETKPPEKQQDDEPSHPPTQPGAEGYPTPADEPETPPVKGTYTVKGE